MSSGLDDHKNLYIAAWRAARVARQVRALDRHRMAAESSHPLYASAPRARCCSQGPSISQPGKSSWPARELLQLTMVGPRPPAANEQRTMAGLDQFTFQVARRTVMVGQPASREPAGPYRACQAAKELFRSRRGGGGSDCGSETRSPTGSATHLISSPLRRSSRHGSTTT